RNKTFDPAAVQPPPITPASLATGFFVGFDPNLPSGTTWYTCVPSTCSASNSAYDPVGTRQTRNSQHRVQPILVASASQVAFQSSVNSYGGSRPLSLAAATSFDGLVSARPPDAPGPELRGARGRLEQSRRKMR